MKLIDTSSLIEYFKERKLEELIGNAEIYAALKKEGRLLADADLLIACTAIAKKMPLLTKNTKHFERLKEFGIRLAD